MSDSAIARFTWVIWPWMNWLVPAFVCLHGLFGNGGWESLVLIPASVVLVPGTALLGALPRFLLRRAGYRSAPLPIVPLLFVVWWGWSCVGAAMPGATDGAPLPSMLDAMTGGRLPSAIETGVMAAGAAAALVCWSAVLVIAVRLRARPAATEGPGRRRTSEIVAWTAAFVVPLTIIGSCVAGVGLQATAQDADGDTFAAVAARDADARDELDRQRYEATQRALATVRAQIAPNDWTGAEARARSARDCPWRTATTDCYAITARFARATSASPDFAALADALRASGWEVEDAVTDEWGAVELETRSPAGVSVRVRFSTGAGGQQFVNTTATSPSWWGASFEVRLNTAGIDAEQRFTADDFPRL
ncbi:hypothetical protein ROT00_06980 [Agromyces mediolanus]|uniref:hypothetical protein n=1 Tax=Agromyces mediolanus TaxID=41986 RepID=UPI0038380A44